MSNASTRPPLMSLLISAFFVLAGFVTLYDSLSYTDRDSQVFPQTVAVIMILAASVACLQWFSRSIVHHEEGFGEGVWWRRLLIIASMLFACYLISITGFLWASLVAFAGGMVAAMHNRWSLPTLGLYGGSGVLTIGVFYALFKFALHVPLP